jgi:acetylornithine deacetylase/succinyl-diaminopimelate desuccinylase-like protein
MASEPTELVLNRTWRPSLAVTGIDGMPAIVDAGNVLRPFTAAKLSMRLPPTADPLAAEAAVRSALTDDPPHGVKIGFASDTAYGWNAPSLAPWLERAVGEASLRHFGQDAAAMGEGGSIPFMAMLGDRYPAAQFLITGVLGPGSNAHGPNEFLDIATGKRLTACVADVLAARGRVER